MGNLSLSQVATSQNNKETTINDADAQIEQAITELFSKSLTGLVSPITLVTSEYLRAIRLDFTGAITSAFTVNFPAVKKLTIVSNSTTGGFDVFVQISGGTSVKLKPGAAKVVYADGTNVNLIVDLDQRVGSFVAGKPQAAAQMMRLIAPFGFTIKANLPGARITAKTTPADATKTFSLQKNDVEFATIALAVGGAKTFTCAADTTFIDNTDIFSIVTPGVQDSAMSDVSIIVELIRASG